MKKIVLALIATLGILFIMGSTKKAPPSNDTMVVYDGASTYVGLILESESHDQILDDYSFPLAPKLGTVDFTSRSIKYTSNGEVGEDKFTVNYKIDYYRSPLPNEIVEFTDTYKVIILDRNTLTLDVNNTPISGPTKLARLSSDVNKSVGVESGSLYYTIKSLPDPKYGILHRPDGTTEVRVGDKIYYDTYSTGRPQDLIFVPKEGMEGNTSFTYTVSFSTSYYPAEASELITDPTPATFTIPIIKDTRPRVTISDASEKEGTDLIFDINLSNKSTESIEININTQEVNATAGEDYTKTENEVVVIPAGITGVALHIPTEVDDTYEGNEVFYVKATIESGDALTTEVNATGTIIDADAPPTVMISNETATEGNDLVFDINLSHLSADDVVIDINTTSGTATKDVDFTGKVSTEVITGGNTGITVTVVTIDDSDIEEDETFSLKGTITSDNTANTNVTSKGTIKDNDLITSNIAPETVNVNNSQPISIYEDPVDIDDLQGYDTDGSVTGYRITILPDPLHGTLYMADGTTAVILNQVLTLTEASGLKFDPEVQYDSPASAFLYAAIDDKGAQDSTDAIFMIPLYDPSPLPPIPSQDNDSDGFSPPEDCDDNNFLVNPDIPEDPFNGIDDNCDGQIDEDGIV